MLREFAFRLLALIGAISAVATLALTGKARWLWIIIVPSAFLAIILTKRPNVSGKWSWSCCGGEYDGEMDLTQTGTQINGTLKDRKTDQGRSYLKSSPVRGFIEGNRINFRRQLADKEQYYVLILRRNWYGRRTLEGFFTGPQDPSLGTEFTATRRKRPP